MTDDWCLSTALILTHGCFIADKTIKLWKISERDKRPEGYNLKEEDGRYRDPTTVTTLRVSGSQSVIPLSQPLALGGTTPAHH